MNARAASAVLTSTVSLATAFVVATTGLIAGVGLVATTAPAQAVQPTQDLLVSDDPVDFTPHVLDGEVLAIAVIGDTVVLGGNFTKVEQVEGGEVLTRNRILAFDRTTGVIDTAFAPVLDATVRTLAPGPDGQSVYVGGQFTTVGTVPASKVARLDLDDGTPVPGFSPGVVNALVYDLKLAGDRLFIAGQFTRVGGKGRSLIAELNPETGAVKGKRGPVFSGTHNGGPTFIYKFDVNPDGRTLAAIGNFSTVGSQARMQAAVLKVRNKSLRLADWQTARYEPACYSVFQYYVRDVEYSPNGEYFIISTTGGYGSGPPTLCDTATRWDADARGQAIDPEWIAYTGGDSSYAIALTGTAVYIGGHQRWWNNPFGVDAPGQGAVPREGIAALDPLNGLPLSWDPVRARGRGVFDMVATAEGLWVGSDTDRIGHFEYHGRIAFFPLAGGTVVPRPKPPTLPVDAYVVEAPPPGGDPVLRWSFDGDVPGPVRTAAPGDVDWTTVRGGFWLDGNLYLGQSDGTLSVRSYDGETFGAATTLNLYGLTDFQGELATLTGLFYNAGSIYFTVAGDPNLYERYFTVESGVVGATRFTLPSGGVSWSTSTGMFYAERGLFWADAATGDLHRIDFTGVPVAGTATVVSGPTSDGRDWRGDALFSLPPAPPNEIPTAAIDTTCGGTTCNFDGSRSADHDGDVTGYAWDFGDGDTASGAQVEHVYDTVGSYDVTLTVTDDDGGTGTSTTEVTVVASSVQFVGSAAQNLTGSVKNQTVTLPAGIAALDQLVLTMTTNSPTATATDPSGWVRAGASQSGGSTVIVWTRAAAADSAGSVVTVTTSAFVKSSLLVAAYRDASVPAGGVKVAAETITRTTHTTPVATAPTGSWVVSAWTDKTTGTTGWTAPPGQQVRETGAGTGTAYISWLLTDSGGGVAAGEVGGLTATATTATANATMVTVVVAPTLKAVVS